MLDDDDDSFSESINGESMTLSLQKRAVAVHAPHDGGCFCSAKRSEGVGNQHQRENDPSPRD